MAQGGKQYPLFDDHGRPAAATEPGVLYRDDNLAVLRDLPDGSVDLIYLDPPFFTNRIYEVIWGEEAEIRSFKDRWEGGIQHYIEWMYLRAVELHRVLKPNGSLFFHCDPHASHYLKVMLDGLFGMTTFRNEIIWRRYGSHNDSAQGSKHFGRVHDTLLLYTKGNKPTWNQLYTPLDREYVKKNYRYIEGETGRQYMTTPLTGPGGEAKGNPVFEWKGHTRAWRYSKETMQELHDKGRLHYSKTGYARQKFYLEESKGVPVPDIWTDIKPLTGHNRERLGYPTQKPEALLDRIILSSTNPGDVVLDPFCGCGTTVVVAERLKRQWIGIDISATAVEIMRRRLLKHGATARIENAVQSVQDLKELKPFEFQNWVINAIYGTHSPRRVHDMGIDGYWFFTKDPVQVKQSERVGRNVVDNFETATRRAGHSRGYIIAFSFTKGAVEEAARAKKEGLDIHLVRVAEVLIEMKRPHGKIGPQPATVEELPLPPMRKPKDLPTVEELIESDEDGPAEDVG